MPKPLTFDLIAREAFRPGDLGWTTPTGVIKVIDFIGLPEGAIRLRSIDHAQQAA